MLNQKHRKLHLDYKPRFPDTLSDQLDVWGQYHHVSIFNNYSFIFYRNKTGILHSALMGTVLLRESDPNSACLKHFKFSLLWPNKENEDSQNMSLRSKNQMILLQLSTSFVMSVLQLMDWNARYFPFWTIQGSLIGNTASILLLTSFLTKNR